MGIIDEFIEIYEIPLKFGTDIFGQDANKSISNIKLYRFFLSYPFQNKKNKISDINVSGIDSQTCENKIKSSFSKIIKQLSVVARHCCAIYRS